ncbi:MAG: putative manganese transporter [Pseudomonadota bacterium]
MTTSTLRAVIAPLLAPLSRRLRRQSIDDRLIALLFFVGLLLIHRAQPELAAVIVETLSDAYLGVSAFVAMTLALFHLLDRHLKTSLVSLLNGRPAVQVPCAALLGALPGCGGAIIVVTQFVHGRMGFGALVAVLIATMGDAAFLLLARDPQAALVVFTVSIGAGILSGYFINRFVPQDHLKAERALRSTNDAPDLQIPLGLQRAFWTLLAPGAVLGLAGAFQVSDSIWTFLGVDPAAETWIGFAGAMSCAAIWFSQPLNSWTARFARCSAAQCPMESTAAETSFVSVWVMVGFLCYELLVHFGGVDLHSAFASLGALAPLLALLIGFIPGCGPQIVVTTLYLNGVVPMAALLANAISNDGDALFPAIALAPRAAIVATLYSAVPAAIVGYLAYWLAL